MVGYEIPLKLFGADVTPFTGFAYRYLNNDMSGKITSVGHFGFERESNYWYSPLGVELRKEFAQGWSAVFSGELDIFWKGRQVNHIGHIPSYVDFTNKQETGFGQRVSLDIVKDTGNMRISVGPFLRHWNIRMSNEAVGAYITPEIPINFIEPQNSSMEVGVKVAVKF